MPNSSKKPFVRDPNAEGYNPPVNMRVTREDWLNVAMEVLISDGVEQVKVLSLREKLGVSRSSFYWYFKSRQDLLDALLGHWRNTNTAALVAQASAPARTITEAVCNVFKCTINPELFDTALDFAIRDWARRSERIRHILDQSDGIRLQALSDMFLRFGYEPLDAVARARVIYYMQMGYDEADLNEPIGRRMELVPYYIKCFTGVEAPETEISAFMRYAASLSTRPRTAAHAGNVRGAS